jgi:hypothetical protein
MNDKTVGTSIDLILANEEGVYCGTETVPSRVAYRMVAPLAVVVFIRVIWKYCCFARSFQRVRKSQVLQARYFSGILQIPSDPR